MSTDHGGFLIRFDDAQRAAFLVEIRDLSAGFSDALSSRDWTIRQWEVCGLMFEPGVITHWALARREKRVVTGKARVSFSQLVTTRIEISRVEAIVRSNLRGNIVSARTGAGGVVPPATWSAMKVAVGTIDRESRDALERLELLRDQSRIRENRPGAVIVAQQRDAVGLLLDIFDQSSELRRQTLRSWTAPDGSTLSSFLSGVTGVKTIEDQLIARDAAEFPGAQAARRTVTGAVFAIGDRKLEVFNINRTELEQELGVDLIYWNEQFDAWTLVQYKSMKYEDEENERTAIFRPDKLFHEQLNRMQMFRDSLADSAASPRNMTAYRLASDGFFFKLCSKVQLEVLSEALLPGMYLPREYVQSLLLDDSSLGPRGGRLITFENAQRHFSNTGFATLVRDGWIGTHGAASQQIAELIKASFSAGHSVVVARSRLEGAKGNPAETLTQLGL